MSSQQLQFYEQKIIRDKEFPIEVFMNRIQDKCQYFHTHWHEHIELHYVVHGETDILLNQTRYTFRQGDLAVINSNVLHAGFCNGTPVEVLVVIFELDELSAQVAEKNILFQPMICADTKIQELMSLIYQELWSDDDLRRNRKTDGKAAEPASYVCAGGRRCGGT